jgi:hypothetical protein
VPTSLSDMRRDKQIAACCAWGLALILCGQQVAWAVRGYTNLPDSAIFPAIPVVLGTLLMVRSHWLFESELQTSPVLVAIPSLLAFLPIAILSLIDVHGLADQFAYMLILCGLTLFVALNKNESFDGLPIALMIVGSVGCALAVIDLTSSPLQYAVRLGVGGNENPLATATNGSITACAALVVGFSGGKDRWGLGVLAAVAFALGLSNVLLSVTQSQILAIIGCVILFVLFLRGRIARDRSSQAQRRKRALSFVATIAVISLCIPIVISATVDPRFIDAMQDYAGSRLTSLMSISEKSSSGQDSSLSLHLYMMDYTWAHLNILGHGMMAQSRRFGEGVYAHMVYLQAIYDFGILGGLLLLIVAAVIPSAIIVLRAAAGPITSTQALVILLFVASQADRVTHGTPYFWPQWPPTMLVYVLFMPRFRVEPLTVANIEAKSLP